MDTLIVDKNQRNMHLMDDLICAVSAALDEYQGSPECKFSPLLGSRDLGRKLQRVMLPDPMQSEQPRSALFLIKKHFRGVRAFLEMNSQIFWIRKGEDVRHFNVTFTQKYTPEERGDVTFEAFFAKEKESRTQSEDSLKSANESEAEVHRSKPWSSPSQPEGSIYSPGPAETSDSAFAGHSN